jgi:molybdenum cofactor synthesis domain-containing protein
MSAPIRVIILTVSDRCSRGETADLSGPALAKIAREGLQADIAHVACLPDEADLLAAFFVERSDPSRSIDLILCTGGTGLAPRDVTPEALRAVMHREHPGLMELARMRCYAKTPRTYLSRGIAGTIHRTLILTFPGSPRGCVEMLEAILDILPHAIETLRGEVKDG